jgi:hypothetical protein
MKMKTMFKLPQLCGAVLLLSCTTSELPPSKNVITTGLNTNIPIEPPTSSLSNFSDVLPSMYPFGERNYFIKGQVSATSNLNANVLFTTKIASPNLGEIIKSGEKLNMVALGGGMTAGVRNGGLYRAGQMTAYPNLVARQMGITDFQTPLFAENEANGTGYLQLVDDGTQYPTWKEVNNIKATVKAGSPPELAKYTGGSVHNYAMPGGGLSTSLNPFTGLGVNEYGRSWRTEQVYASRVIPISIYATKVSLADQVMSQPINFYILEDDCDDLISLIRDNYDITSWGSDKANLGYAFLIDNLIQRMKEKSNATKGVVFTWPIISDLAYFNWYTIQDLKSKANSISIITSGPKSYKLDENTNNVLFNPTSKVDALFRSLKKGDNISVTLENADVIDPWEFNNNTGGIRTYNNYIRASAKKAGLAIVDLEKIYGQIHSNTYVSSDGYKVDGGTKGNFFSSDGVYPTAIGQAVIANEVIKSINATYKSTIPLINLKDYSLLVGKE